MATRVAAGAHAIACYRPNLFSPKKLGKKQELSDRFLSIVLECRILHGGPIMASQVHFEVNVCGGDFQHMQDCFRAWKKDMLVYRTDRRMFEGKTEVRLLSDRTFDSTEEAHNALRQACRPHDPYALAAA